MLSISKHYKIIQKFYDGRVNNRSKTPLINHISEGLILLDYLGASREVKAAWCIHPIVQSDDDMFRELSNCVLLGADSKAIILAMEYRHIANSFLSFMVDSITTLQIDTLKDIIGRKYSDNVKLMLVADKVQNFKDFLCQPRGTYHNEVQLEIYFYTWISNILQLSQDTHMQLDNMIK